MASCHDEDAISPALESEDVVSFSTSNGKVDIPIVDGTLHFPDVATFVLVEDAVSSTEERQITEQQLDAIEAGTSFLSLRRYLISKIDPYLYGSLPYEALRAIVAEHYYSLYLEDELPLNVFADRTQRALLNKDGVVVVGNDKVIHRRDMEIHLPLNFDIDFANLPTVTNEELGIVVLGNEETDNSIGRSFCTRPAGGEPNALQRFAQGPEINEKRVTTLGGVRAAKILRRSNGGFGLPESWEYYYRYYSEHRSWARAAWGNHWRQGTRAKTRLRFKLGLGIETQSGGSATSGTGWVSDPDELIRTITTSWNPYNIGTFIINYYATGARATIYDYDLTYLTSGVRNENDQSNRSFVFACCPWTCAELGYFNFP
jgi:hypothetical protein